MDSSTLKDSAEEAFSTTSFCDNCGRKNNVGDSFTIHKDGRILRCEHWPPISQVVNQ